MDNDYKNFVERMGSFEDVIDLDSGNIDAASSDTEFKHSVKNFVENNSTFEGVSMWQYNDAQSNNELMHYGKKGMKWGKRSRVARATGSVAATTKSEAASAHKLAKGYTNAIEKRAAKKPNSLSRQNDVVVANKLAKGYTNAMDKKATKAKTAHNVASSKATVHKLVFEDGSVQKISDKEYKQAVKDGKQVTDRLLIGTVAALAVGSIVKSAIKNR